jgi:hypothetical protein
MRTVKVALMVHLQLHKIHIVKIVVDTSAFGDALDVGW